MDRYHLYLFNSWVKTSLYSEQKGSFRVRVMDESELKVHALDFP